MKRVRSITSSAVAAGLCVVLLGHRALGAPPAEAACQAALAKEAARYASCAKKAIGQFYPTEDGFKYAPTAGKCVLKYVSIWPRLQARFAGTGATCEQARFVDNGDLTVTDHLTSLVWEKKRNGDNVPNPGDPHDNDNTYRWSAGGAGFTAADGEIFTDFLPALNTVPCFAGQCDWRLPTRDELLTIATPPCVTTPCGPCNSATCLDPAFGPLFASGDWSGTTLGLAPHADEVWAVSFLTAGVVGIGKGSGANARAVRTGTL